MLSFYDPIERFYLPLWEIYHEGTRDTREGTRSSNNLSTHSRTVGTIQVSKSDLFSALDTINAGYAQVCTLIYPGESEIVN